MAQSSNKDPDRIGQNGIGDEHFSVEGDSADLPAWTEIEEGRFMPRRIRGSFQGRALG